MTHRIQSGWQNWKRVSGILCDRRISLRVKGKVYKTVVRPAMMYGAETWAVKKAQEKKLDVAEMRMLTFSPLYRPVPAALGSPLRRPLSTSWPPPHAGFKRLQRRLPSQIAIAILHIQSCTHKTMTPAFEAACDNDHK